jgi:hypothetical protein
LHYMYRFDSFFSKTLDKTIIQGINPHARIIFHSKVLSVWERTVL